MIVNLKLLHNNMFSDSIKGLYFQFKGLEINNITTVLIQCLHSLDNLPFQRIFLYFPVIFTRSGHVIGRLPNWEEESINAF